MVIMWPFSISPDELACFAHYSRTNYTVFGPEIMPKINLLGMNVEALMDLQKRVDAMLGSGQVVGLSLGGLLLR